MLGALVVQMQDGRRFRLGSGFTDAQRAAPPPIGSLVTYRYNGLTRNGLPRFARFQRVRLDPAPPDPR
jgi:DNA ligase-1